ncbi:hypothetical protein, partial [Acetobacter aceti]|uniref:hypothetical protein n=1 Tax=Acetobacter aceti TaxID=435 RepID=UPI001A9FBE38
FPRPYSPLVTLSKNSPSGSLCLSSKKTTVVLDLRCVAGGSEGVGTKGVAALPFALPLAGRTKGWGFEGADARVIFGGKPPLSV